MPTVNLSPLFNDAQLDSSGNPYSGAKLFTYAAGSSTKQNTYTSSAGSVAQTNPIILNARGEPTNGPIWLTDGQTYKFVLTTPGDTDPPASPIRTIDNVSGINDVAASSASEWAASLLTPTYVSAISFTLVGDQTTEFHVGRRVKATVTAGTVYGYISASAYGALTTLSVQLDTGSLDSGLSAVALGLNSAANRSDPLDDSAIINPYAPLTAFENLAVATASVSTATITADKIVVTNSSGRKAVLSTVSLTVNIASAGANGLDTGAEAASTWYYLWVIWNGATTAGLISASATAPTMPTGYTHKGLAGAVYNSSGSDFIGMNQRGRDVAIVEQAALAGGSATAVTSFSLAAFIPPNVWTARLYSAVTALSTTIVTASVWADAAGLYRTQRLGYVSTTDAAQITFDIVTARLFVSQTLYYSVTNANTDLDIYVIGWSW